MNSQIARQQSKQCKVRVAAREGRNNTSARTYPTRRQAIGSLVRCLETNPSRKEWMEATDSVLLGRWPNLRTLQLDDLLSALAEFRAIMKEARASVRAKLTPEELLLNEMAQEQVLEANHHQAAVNSLRDLSRAAHWSDAPVVVSVDEAPTLFRAVIEEAKTLGSRNPYPEETDLIEYALMLIDRNGGDATVRTPEQEQFYADLDMSLDANGQVRITYSPSNVTVH